MKKGLVYLIAVIFLFFSIYQYQELKHQRTQPITIPIVSVDGNTISKIFTVDHNTLYSIELNFEGNVRDDDGNILYSSESYGANMPKNGKGLLELKWILYHENKVIVEKQSKDLLGYGGGEHRCYTTLGDFNGVKGSEYLLEVTVLSSHPKVGMMNPKVTIGKHYTVIEGTMWCSGFYLILGLISASIVVSKAICDMFNVRRQT